MSETMLQISVTITLFALLCPGILARGMMRHQFLQETLTMKPNGVNPGKPLFLTPYIEKGDIKTAQKLSQVGPLKGTNIKSHSGFFTVDKQFNSNMFFWFFPAQKNPSKAPVVLWLQGGPGGSSLFGLFVESGPIGVDKNLNLFHRNVTWNSKYSMLYIDNPVGTGFSFTSDDAGYATNETAVAINLYTALVQFYKLFPNLKNNEFYITGESYAGKYLPALAYWILKHGDPSLIKLTGVAIGDGFSDPPTMLPHYADFIFYIGLFDENQRDYFSSQVDKAVQLIRQKQWIAAMNIWDRLLNGDTQTSPSYFTNVTGLSDYYNYMRPQSPADFQYYNKFVTLPEVRKSIHVGDLPYNSGDKVAKHLLADMLQSVKPWLAEVMDNYRVMLYSGQLDIIVAVPLTAAMLQTVPWRHLEEYKKANRTIWKVHPSDVDVAGYVRQVKDFYQVTVRGGGHILPYDQPERTFDLIDRFISRRGFK